MLKKSGKYDYIFVEGFLIFEDKQLASMLDKMYFILLDKEESKRRRALRCYKSVDTPNYFDKCVWVEFLKYQKKCKANHSGIVYLDGHRSRQELLKEILVALNELENNIVRS